MSRERLHPAVWMTYYLLVLAVAMFYWNPLLQSFALLGGMLYFAAIAGGRAFLSEFSFTLPLAVLVAITNPLFSHAGATPLFFMNGNPVTLEAVLYGILLAGMILSVLYWCKCLSMVMTTDRLLTLFGGFLPKLALTFSMTLRFFPRLFRQMKAMEAAGKTSGLLAGDSFFDRLRGRMKMLPALIGWSLERAMETSASMKARGYGLPGRTNAVKRSMRGEDILFLAVVLLLGGLTLLSGILGGLNFWFYPRISPLPTGGISLMGYSSYGLLCFLPVFLEWKEWYQWHLLRKKIPLS
jgi:energy-coupling factor transport system permease protein